MANDNSERKEAPREPETRKLKRDPIVALATIALVASALLVVDGDAAFANPYLFPLLLLVLFIGVFAALKLLSKEVESPRAFSHAPWFIKEARIDDPEERRRDKAKNRPTEK